MKQPMYGLWHSPPYLQRTHAMPGFPRRGRKTVGESFFAPIFACAFLTSTAPKVSCHGAFFQGYSHLLYHRDHSLQLSPQSIYTALAPTFYNQAGGKSSIYIA